MQGRRFREIELLAPARNADIGIAAIDCGADAVYIAGPRFGARQAAGNEMEDIEKLCVYAHRFGARIFVTLNTILYDDELDSAKEQLLASCRAGADAVIVQDLALAMLAREAGCSIPLHASTQCAIRTPEQAAFYEKAGFSRLILERELSLDQIRSIRDAVDCELEFFVHGALCVCYSGQCYMSEALAGRSANRGACVQACRSLYDLEDGDGNVLVKNKALLSLKDFRLRDRLADLASAGISSFKIEGRLKNASYVRNTVRDYSIALDNLTDTSGGMYRRASFGKVTGGFVPDTDKTFNRGYTELFIDGKRSRGWSTFDSAKAMGKEIGTVSYVGPGKNIFRIELSGDETIANGDGLSFVDGKSEAVGFRADVCQGNEVRCKPVPGLFAGARLFRNLDTAFEKELESSLPVRRIPASVSLAIEGNGQSGYVLRASVVSEDGRRAEAAFGAGSLKAENEARMKSVLETQISKSSGIYDFSVKDISYSDSLPFMPVSSVNAVRRELAEKLDAMPCNRIPLENRTGKALFDGKCGVDITYKANVSNKIASEEYARAGAVFVEPAFELTRRKGVELMRTRYCIRFELGLCPSAGNGKCAEESGIPSALFLVNNGKKFRLGFDCSRCEMTVNG